VPSEVYFVVPAYNEAKSIEWVISSIAGTYPGARVVVIDDGSIDGTAAVAGAAGARLIRLPVNSGYGVALHTGLRWAAMRKASLVVTLDADGQHDPVEARGLIDLVSSGVADIAIGSRYREAGAQYRVPMSRLWGSRFFAALLSALIGQRLTDPTSGFQCLNSRALETLSRMEDFPAQTPDADVLFYLHRQGIRIREVGVRMYADAGNDSMHGTLKSFFYAPKMLVSIAGVLLAKPRHRNA
jgi:glycosyltransferase involved in cell wall biosynthesis